MNKPLQLAMTESPWLSRFPSIVDELLDTDLIDSKNSGLAVSEDDTSLFVEAALPGIEPKKIQISLDNGVLRVHGKAHQEKSNRKFYRRTAEEYTYTIALPAEVDESIDPVAECSNGVVTIAFTKVASSKPKKIPVKAVKL